MEGSQYDHLTYDELHNLCKSRGYCEKDAEAVLKTRLEAMDTAERNSPQVQSGNMDTSFSALGERARSRSVSHKLETPTQVGVGKRVRGVRLWIWLSSVHTLSGGPPTSNLK